MFKDFDFGQFFADLNKQRILIIGDVMIDTYLWGRVGRISPEAPVPIVSGIIEENRLGGAANVALNIKAMGAVPILCAVIGDDERGDVFLELLKEQQLSDIGITVDDYRITTQKTRIISGNQHLLRVDEEMDELLGRRLEEVFITLVSDLLESGGINAIIIQDYDKGVVTPKILKSVMHIAGEQNIPVLVDPKNRNFHLYEKVQLFKPNFKELKEGLDLELSKENFEEIGEVAEKLRKEKGHDMVMVTLSDKGIVMAEDGGIHYIPPFKRDVSDVSGAGDTVISIAALGLVAGLHPAQLAAIANLAGGQVCEKPGVVPVNKVQLMEEVKKFQE